MSAHKIIEYRYTTWDDFKIGFLQNLPGLEEMIYENFIFRGQRNSTWGLVASFDRIYQSRNLKNREELFNYFLRTFKEEALKANYIKEGDNLESITAKAQHYGMPTRLLDWTYSPYIAAFFAFSDPSLLIIDSTDDIAIWAMNKNSVKRSIHSNMLRFIELYEGNNDRLIAQSGLFTRLYSSSESLDEFLLCEDESKSLIKFTIPSSEAERALFDLSLMGINSKSLFLGLEGVARYATVKSTISLANNQKVYL